MGDTKDSCVVLFLALGILMTVGEVSTQCLKNESMTFDNFIRLLKKGESHEDVKGRSAGEVLLMLTRYFASDENFATLFKDQEAIKSFEDHAKLTDAIKNKRRFHGLTGDERPILQNMLAHGATQIGTDNRWRETGVIQTPRGDTVAIGHVITGMIGGLNRDRKVSYSKFFKPLDNIYALTISGDLGQSTCCRDDCTTVIYGKSKKIKPDILGPGGSWSDKCHFVITKCPSEATDAEILGDMDGFILGIESRLWKDKTLSDVFVDYYNSSGSSYKINDSVRFENFHLLISDYELTFETWNFWDIYKYADSVFNVFATNTVPTTVDRFYARHLSYTSSCPPNLKDKHKITSFIGMVKTLEISVPLLGDIVKSILGLSTYYSNHKAAWSQFEEHLNGLIPEIDASEPSKGFDWYTIYTVVHVHAYNTPHKLNIQTGLVQDNQKVTLVVGHVLAGMSAGLFDRNVFGTTIGGTLCLLARRYKHLKYQKHGQWTDGCPARYIPSAFKESFLPRIYADMDGFVLGSMIIEIQNHSPNIKLSKILSQYYGNGLEANASVSSQTRHVIFSKLLPKDDLTTELELLCDSSPSKCGANQYINCKSFSQRWSDALYRYVITLPKDTSSLYNSRRLPVFRAMLAVYPGYKENGGSNDVQDLEDVIGGAISGDSSPVRISLMLNKLPGNFIPDSPGTMKDDRGDHYFMSTDELTNYLSQKYGAPKHTVSAGATGIVAVGAATGRRLLSGHGASIGLWNGHETFQAPSIDVNSAGIQFWEVKEQDCKELAERGDCNFYIQCIQNLKALSCSENSYPIAYGYKYCRKFEEHRHRFTDKGKTWIDKVRVCLMNYLLPERTRPMMTCKKIKEIAFASHVDCYLKSGDGICNVFCDELPTNIDALSHVYESGDFFNEDWKQSLQQMLVTAIRCIPRGTIACAADLWTKLKVFQRDLLNAATGDEPKALSAANAGKCEFFEYFESKFPCSKVSGSHMADVETLLCQLGEEKKSLMNSQGKVWFKEYMTCLTQALVSTYHNDTITCSQLEPLVTEKRLDCFRTTGLCDVYYPNRLALERWTDVKGYPYILPDETLKRPLTGEIVALKTTFFQEALTVRALFDDILLTCNSNK